MFKGKLFSSKVLLEILVFFESKTYSISVQSRVHSVVTDDYCRLHSTACPSVLSVSLSYASGAKNIYCYCGNVLVGPDVMTHSIKTRKISSKILVMNRKCRATSSPRALKNYLAHEYHTKRYFDRRFTAYSRATSSPLASSQRSIRRLMRPSCTAGTTTRSVTSSSL